MLEDAIKRNPSSAKARYYLGNLYYDKRRYEVAIACWRVSVELDGEFSIPWRNLGIAEFNVMHNPQAASQMYQRAFAADGQDARLLYEWDQLKKRAALALPEERLGVLEMHKALVSSRDDLTVEYVTLLNQLGQHQRAMDILNARRFSPWEGGEGLVSEQYVYSHRALGRVALAEGNPLDALAHFESARRYPENLGEGKHLLTLERDLDYLSGLAAHQLGKAELAHRFWAAAAAPLPALGIHSYFQSLALKELGEIEKASAILASLMAHAVAQMDAELKIDYFATSLPNLLLFDDDLILRNRVKSLLLNALASHGLGDGDAARNLLRQVIADDPNHLLATEMLGWFEQGSAEEARIVKAEPAS